MVKCVQCENEHTGSEQVCEFCIEDAMRLVEGQLGGRPTVQQIARMFDMGGGGCAPVRDIDLFRRQYGRDRANPGFAARTASKGASVRVLADRVLEDSDRGSGQHRGVDRSASLPPAIDNSDNRMAACGDPNLP